MDYITSGIRHMFIGSSQEMPITKPLFISIHIENKDTYKYQGENDEQTSKFYYNLMNRINISNQYTNCKTTVSLEGNTTNKIYFTTYKNIF
ncbi:hypothetical protein crov499 [Cafeteria roenbergensis virus]|uniref:Uncharacterized protein n=1 Tax=Cafeteria roenbergensis virus (strain BV-PW1) TaxID=693272 RepID=E3T5S0_CROVB|nr:hypothetical protein crov499 [Cafeteria roenbergensis virus BV-PW1]ADO67533.1 hypothetical protein crov499 [Cafeteria roenbergensis virus BV-PW1]